MPMSIDKVEDCLKLRRMYEEKLKAGPYPTSEVTPQRFPEPAPGIILMYLADVAGIASHGEKLLSLESKRRDQFREVVAESFKDKFPDISQRITLGETPKLCRFIDDTENACVLIRKVLAD